MSVSLIMKKTRSWLKRAKSVRVASCKFYRTWWGAFVTVARLAVTMGMLSKYYGEIQFY